MKNLTTMMRKLPKCPGYPDRTELHSNIITSLLWGSWLNPMATIHRKCTAALYCRYTDWRPNLLHGVSAAVFVGSRPVDSLLTPAFEM